jgi:hypothetical protein
MRHIWPKNAACAGMNRWPPARGEAAESVTCGLSLAPAVIHMEDVEQNVAAAPVCGAMRAGLAFARSGRLGGEHLLRLGGQPFHLGLGQVALQRDSAVAGLHQALHHVE